MSGRPTRRLAVIGCAALLALAAGCARHPGAGSGALGSTTPTTGPSVPGGGDPGIDGGTGATDGTGGTGGPSTDPTSATPAATHTTTPPSHPPTVTPATHAYPDDYAAAVLAAWAARDSAYLALLTSSTTAHTILGYGDINTHWTLINNDGAAGSTYASYYNNGGDEIVLRLANSEVGAHHWHAASVYDWDVMTFPGTATAYARKYVDGWIAGNVARMNLLGTTALTAYYRGGPTPNPGYTLNPPTGAGSEVEVEFVDASAGVDSSLIIKTASLGHQHAIVGCDIGC